MGRSNGDRCKIYWATDYGEHAIGNAYGYRVHNNTLREYVRMIADLREDAPNALLITAPEFYKRIEGKVNFLFTMFEGTTLPDIYVKAIKQADYLIAPSTWVKERFDQYFAPAIKSFVVNHGVEGVFSYKKRHYPTDRPFRYLWMGAPNPRKGWEEIVVVWDRVGFKHNPTVELYLKTTRVEGLQRKGNVILDGRNLTKRQLAALYHKAHCFVFPTRGEGFGLTLAEAMRTGLPCIATDYSGVRDFFDSTVGYPIGYKMGEGEMTFIGTKLKARTQIAFPDIVQLVEAMAEVRKNYDEALKRGKRASARIRTRFTWPLAAKRLVDVIKEYGR